MSRTARELVAAVPGTGVSRLFPLLDELVDGGSTRAEALQALLDADRDARQVQHQVDLFTGEPWRSDPAAVEVVVPIDPGPVHLHVELVPVPTPSLVAWRGPADAAPPELVDALRSAATDGTLAPAVGPLAQALGRWRAGCALAAGEALGALAAGADALPGGAVGLEHIALAALDDLERDLDVLPDTVLAALDAVRDALRSWAAGAATVWPTATERWAALAARVPVGSDEPDPTDDTMGRLEASAGADQVFRDAPVFLGAGNVLLGPLLTGPVAVTRLFQAPVASRPPEAGRVLTLSPRLAVARAVAVARDAAAAVAGSNDPLVAAARAEQRWWALRSEVVLATDVPPEPGTDPAAHVPRLGLAVIADGEVTRRLPLAFDAGVGVRWSVRLPDDLGPGALVVVRADLADPEVDDLLLWARRLEEQEDLASAVASYEAMAAVADTGSPLGDDSDERLVSLRALAATKAALGLRELSRAIDARAEALTQLAFELRPGLAQALSDAPAEARATAISGDLRRLRNALGHSLRRIVASDRDGSRLVDVREVGAQIVAIDQLLTRPPNS